LSNRFDHLKGRRNLTVLKANYLSPIDIQQPGEILLGHLAVSPFLADGGREGVSVVLLPTFANH
jgi:hypothetical protein